MKKIFVSKIKNTPIEYMDGVKIFNDYLESLYIKRYTLGETIYALKNPFDTITDLIIESDFVIILGIPENISSAVTTPWCHIEATIAILFQKPTIIIKDKAINSGIFSRGAANLYIYEVDMKNKNWFYENSDFISIINHLRQEKAA